MSTIPYPHRATVLRPAAGTPPVDGTDLDGLDGWGNVPRSGVVDEVETIPCWIQSKQFDTSREKETVGEDGDEVSTHTVFCEVRSFGPRDFLSTLAGGGQEAGVRHRILRVRNPDGGTDHLELDTLEVRRGTP